MNFPSLSTIPCESVFGFAGILLTQLWSFAGAPRTAVNQTSTEVDLSYNFESGWYIQTDPTITYDWSATPRQALTLPVGIDVGKVTKIGGQDVSFQLGAYPPFGRILALVANRDCSDLTPRAAGPSADRPALHRRARTSGLPISNRGSAGTVNLAARPLAEAHRGG
jgi:hypothetical protein